MNSVNKRKRGRPSKNQKQPEKHCNNEESFKSKQNKVKKRATKSSFESETTFAQEELTSEFLPLVASTPISSISEPSFSKCTLNDEMLPFNATKDYQEFLKFKKYQQSQQQSIKSNSTGKNYILFIE